ncbi:MAG: hypothetical protein MUC36_17305 [Planctomycetes bacterium]|jgi:hypothetical protein|nr:hypothetical protein [Planctomycetota bacterium]
MNRTLALAALLGANLVAQESELRRDGAHTTLLLQRGPLAETVAGPLADQALAAAELAWTTTQKLLPISAGGPRLTVRLHAVEAEFRAAEKTGSALTFPVEAFPVFDTATAHVLLWPKLSAQALERTGLPGSTRDAIVHTVALLLAHRAAGAVPATTDCLEIVAAGVLVNVTNPKWQDGIDAAYDALRWQMVPPHIDPALNLRGWLLDPPAARDRSHHELLNGRRLVLAQLMSAQSGWAKKLLQKPKPKAGELAPYEAVLGEDWGKIQTRFARLRQELAPRWQLSQPVFELRGDRWLLIGDPDRHAAVYGATPPPPVPYVFRAKVEHHFWDDVSLRLQLDWDGTSMLGLRLGDEVVVLSRWEPSKGWSELDKRRIELPSGRPYDLAVEVHAKELRVILDGTLLVTWPHDRAMRGVWSLANGDSVAWLTDPRVEPLGAAKK